LAAETAYIGCGANLGDRQQTLESALESLHRVGGVTLVAVSGAYETSPVGPVAQGDFLNAVAQIETSVAPRPLLEALLRVEADHGRVRQRRWGPRSLDLDLLLLGEHRVAEPGLTVPHLHLVQRRFVLEPLLELAPDLVHPVTGQPLARHLAGLSTGERVRRLGPLRLPLPDQGDPGQVDR
jgi:2-amino-4-hydroxy-6-hydroxymethyldihydropteridine diphosphokinase